MSYDPPENTVTPSTKADLPLPPGPVSTGRFPYGWRAVPVLVVTELPVIGKPNYMPFPENYRKEFSHPPRTILLGAPRRGGKWVKLVPTTDRQRKRCNQCKPTRYLVGNDQSIRRVDKLLRKKFAGMTAKEQMDLIQRAIAA